jgi:hypothetical protein
LTHTPNIASVVGFEVLRILTSSGYEEFGSSGLKRSVGWRLSDGLIERLLPAKGPKRTPSKKLTCLLYSWAPKMQMI